MVRVPRRDRHCGARHLAIPRAIIPSCGEHAEKLTQPQHAPLAELLVDGHHRHQVAPGVTPQVDGERSVGSVFWRQLNETPVLNQHRAVPHHHRVRVRHVELSPLGITAYSIKAGVTDTPALRKIPGNEQIVESARARNPAGRLTTPEDVAACLLALCAPGAHWLTGSVLNVDSGEVVAG